MAGALTLRLPLLLPLASAFVYAAGAILVKQAISRGASSWAVAFFSNLALGLFFAPLLLFGHGNWNASQCGWAVLAGALFFAGQIGTFRSLAAGDVSIATPVLGSKLVFVALLCTAIPGNRPDPDLWLAVGLTVAGVALLHRGPRRPASHPLATAGWALLAAACFAATDVAVQTKAPKAGFTLFVPIMFGVVMALSLPPMLARVRSGGSFRGGGGRGAWLWGGAGIALLVLQSAAVAAAIGIFGDAAGVNVVYSSRGLWSLLLVAAFAHRLGANEASLDRLTFASRVLGCILVTAAVVIVLV